MRGQQQQGFLPWIGENYNGSGYEGLRLLVLGESHYRDQSEDPEFTKGIIQEVAIDHDPKFAYYTKLRRLLQQPNTEDLAGRSAFWHSVAFYSFVQQSVGSAARERPSPEQWASGRTAFTKLLTQIRPHIVLATGQELWNNLPLADTQPEWLTPKGDTIKGKTYRQTDGFCTVAGHIKHPSGRGFSYAASRDRWSGMLSYRRQPETHQPQVS